MLIGFLIMTLFGGGSVDVFYIDKLEPGVNKFVENKIRQKKLKVELKEYKKAVHQFNKWHKKRIKELKIRNLDKNTTKKWYEEFFAMGVVEIEQLQEKFMHQRIFLQENIKQDEWDKIMNMASDVTAKSEEKDNKKKKKENDKDLFENLKTSINVQFVDEDKLVKSMMALNLFEQMYYEINDAYENININETDFLKDKNATKAQMIKLTGILNDKRAQMYKAYTDFVVVLKENTNDEEWEVLIKKLNKTL